ncbi:hypothetical protein U8326_15445 [Tsuneonella sp. CC-YZS046]|uniref:hypothetical protein n=1 Tax=Tsuneonella sp. CC-YZS046 TaxID=3042152 RepID=UPI002D7692CD|nr:hypothetical protein [Tsuneonella sp. CC-YZS046]WRO66409.1 hypothetical protein U8326_15445 [Tsuneonella sp. CC-YZS046]
MAEAAKRRKSLGLIVEQYAPLVLSVGSSIAIYVLAPAIIAKFEPTDGWQVSSLYGAIFNWSAIQTGFAFGVYGFVVGKNDGFVQEIRDKLAMRRFLAYVRRANIGGFVLTVMSLPLTIANPPISDPQSPMFFVVLGWFGLFLWTFLAFLRVAYGFGKLSSVRDQPEFYGA